MHQVQHVFPMFKSGKFVAGKGFIKKNVQASTESWYRKSAGRFCRTPAKFDAVLRRAARYRKAPRAHTVTHEGGLEAPDVFNRSSPPLEDNDYSGEPVCSTYCLCCMLTFFQIALE